MPHMSKPRRATPCGKAILERLEELSLSVAELERRTPLSKNTIANAIHGPRQPQRKTLEILAQALDLPPHTLTRPNGPASLRPAGNAGFVPWLLRRGNIDTWIVLGGALLAAMILWRSLASAVEARALGHGLHVLILLLLLARLPRLELAPNRPGGGGGLPLALIAAKDLRRYWGGAWLCWFFLYLGLSAGAFFGLSPEPEATQLNATRWLAVGLNLLQNGTTVLLLLIYEVLARPTVKADLSRKQVLPKEAWLAVALLPPLLEATLVASGQAWQLQQTFAWLSGFAQGTALALVVGRLDSKYIEPPALVVALLYIYAAIQGAWAMIQQHHELLLILTFLALVLKCLLFLFVAWLFDSHTLLYYLTRVRRLDDGVGRDRREFLRKV